MSNAPERPRPTSEIVDALYEAQQSGFETLEPPFEDERTHRSVDPEDVLGEELDELGVSMTERDEQIIARTLARKQQQVSTGAAPVYSASVPTAAQRASAQYAVESPGFQGVPIPEKNPASVINLVTRGRMPAGERLRAYLADLNPQEQAALRAFMDDYKMNADSPEIVTAMLMGHIAQVAHVIPNMIDLQVQQASDHLHAALAAYANLPKTIDVQIHNFKGQANESTMELRSELEAFSDAFHERLKTDLGAVLGEYFSNLERLEELIEKHKALLEAAAQAQVKASTQRLEEVEKQLEQKFKKEIGGALISASQDIKNIAQTHSKPAWVPYALMSGAAGMLVGLCCALLLK